MKKKIAEVIETLVGKSFIAKGHGKVKWTITKESKDYYSCECSIRNNYFGKAEISKKHFTERNVQSWI